MKKEINESNIKQYRVDLVEYHYYYVDAENAEEAEEIALDRYTNEDTGICDGADVECVTEMETVDYVTKPKEAQ